jgi:hypothetical protein
MSAFSNSILQTGALVASSIIRTITRLPEFLAISDDLFLIAIRGFVVRILKQVDIDVDNELPFSQLHNWEKFSSGVPEKIFKMIEDNGGEMNEDIEQMIEEQLDIEVVTGIANLFGNQAGGDSPDGILSVYRDLESLFELLDPAIPYNCPGIGCRIPGHSTIRLTPQSRKISGKQSGNLEGKEHKMVF